MQKHRQHLPILILLIVAFVIGIVTVRQYGESWDELQFFKYADRALEAYSTWPRTGSVPLTGNTYDNYGPAYVMLVALGARLLGPILPWITSDVRHLLYFFTWLVGIWAFYVFSRRWLSPVPAFGATLLFTTQPLFWGHAFISPKDIPFLTFILLSLEFGFRMVDSLQDFAWGAAESKASQPLIAFTVAWVVLLIAAFLATPLVQGWIQGMVTAAAAGQVNIVSRIAKDVRTVDPAVYVQRYFVAFLWFRALFFLVSGIALAWTWRKVPAAWQLLRRVLPAAILLGVTTSIRVLGPFTGLVVAGYAVWKMRRGSLLPLSVYVVIALAAMYLTWPYLWLDPLGHLVESVRVMSEYPWRGQVLFDGAMYPSTGLPRSYLPVLLGIQLTEPVWFLFVAGLAILIYEAIRRNTRSRFLLALCLVWFILPFLGFVVTRSPLYDNFRQVIFILPPVFIVGAVVFEKLRRPAWQAALIALVVLPGIVEGASLHPYEYIYYNRFIGGVQGAYRHYELDYWATSYREAADYLNRRAPANGTVWVEGPAQLIQLYARPDLKIFSTAESERADHYDYIVATTRDNLDLTTYPGATVVDTIQREDAGLTVIKQP
ncbi:MAG TPA: hypothetical protein VMJ64_05325 [Anaerolineales bacterium]|nr:hypothetical protein [Anaerolineales bacterium]